MTGVRRGAVAAASVLALVGTACTSEGSADDPSSARAQVERLVAALVEVDADALREIAVDDSLAVSGALLTDEVVAQGVFARKDVRIEADKSNLGYVSYTLDTDPPSGGTQPWLDVDVSSSGGFSGSVLPAVQVHGRGITAIRVGDTEVSIPPLPPEGGRFLLPPGELEIAAVGPTALVEHAAAQQVDTRDRPSLDLGGELTAAGQARVQRAADVFVRRCTRPQRRDDRPRGCPARKAFAGGLVDSSWTLDGPVRVTTEELDHEWAIRTDDPPVARMRGKARDFEADTLVPVTDRVPFRVDGTVSARGDRLVVEIPGY